MQLKRALAWVLLLLATAAAGAAGGYLLRDAWTTPRGEEADPEHEGREIKYWRAPMDPSYTSPRPGKSPMGMDLVPVYEDEEEEGPGIRIDPVVVQDMGIRVAEVISGPLVRELRTVARLDYDERELGVVTLKVSGWIEERHVGETGAPVERGQPLLEIYAPELLVAQEEYLLALRASRAGAGAALGRDPLRGDLLEAARRKLEYWDISAAQVEELARTGEIQRTILIRSPFEGVVTELNVAPGEYVEAGKPLYHIADLSTIWALVSIYEQDLAWISVGQEALLELPYLPGRTYLGRVTFINPYVSPRSRDVKVRLEFPNPGLELKPDMYGEVTILAELAERAVLVPDEAILDTGKRKLVFVALGDGRFEPREIETGVLSANLMRHVVDGLEPGEPVVVSGQFLLDSESRVREAIRKMTPAGLVEPPEGGQASDEGAHGAHGAARGARSRGPDRSPVPTGPDGPGSGAPSAPLPRKAALPTPSGQGAPDRARPGGRLP